MCICAVAHMYVPSCICMCRCACIRVIVFLHFILAHAYVLSLIMTAITSIGCLTRFVSDRRHKQITKEICESRQHIFISQRSSSSQQNEADIRRPRRLRKRGNVHYSQISARQESSVDIDRRMSNVWRNSAAADSLRHRAVRWQHQQKKTQQNSPKMFKLQNSWKQEYKHVRWMILAFQKKGNSI